MFDGFGYFMCMKIAAKLECDTNSFPVLYIEHPPVRPDIRNKCLIRYFSGGLQLAGWEQEYMPSVSGATPSEISVRV